MTRRGGSSGRWRERQRRDIYVGQASREGFRSRALFKLQQIQAKERIFKAGMVCVDLGASPGGWSQLAAKLVGPSGEVWALDVLPMDPLPGVQVLQADFTAPSTAAKLGELIGGRRVDLVLSDMAPNISGNRTVDQSRSMALVEEALRFALEVLKPSGAFLTKAFQGEGVEDFKRDLGAHFATVRTLKPKASRPESREIYLLARNYGM
jgi:23S rRNA (uridine2552-2'-O)-methyltransferase